MLLAGVPRRAGGPWWRRVVWVLLLLVGGFYVQLVLLAWMVAWPLALAVGMGILLGLGVMLYTSPRERRGRERFAVSRAGIARLPLAAPAGTVAPDCVLVEWAGPGGRVELQRLSAFWRRLRLFDGGGSRIFEAGVRCPDRDAPRVLATLEAAAAAEGDGPVTTGGASIAPPAARSTDAAPGGDPSPA